MFKWKIIHYAINIIYLSNLHFTGGPYKLKLFKWLSFVGMRKKYARLNNVYGLKYKII